MSIAAIRHANQLWPSDPIFIRTHLVIPRHRAHRTKRDAPSQSTFLSTSQETDPAWTFSSTLHTVLSALPERISLDTLSSQNSTNEDLELDDLPRQRPHPTEIDSPSPLGVELGILSHSRRKYMSVHNIPSPLEHDIPPISCQQLRNLTSESTLGPSASGCATATAVFVPVRTSQLEPEPAMALSARVKHE